MDTTKRKVVAAFIGDRSKKSGKKLWDLLTKVYHKKGVFYTDKYKSCRGVFPKKTVETSGKNYWANKYD
jgi:IS1 family transposase